MRATVAVLAFAIAANAAAVPQTGDQIGLDTTCKTSDNFSRPDACCAEKEKYPHITNCGGATGGSPSGGSPSGGSPSGGSPSGGSPSGGSPSGGSPSGGSPSGGGSHYPDTEPEYPEPEYPEPEPEYPTYTPPKDYPKDCDTSYEEKDYGSDYSPPNGYDDDKFKYPNAYPAEYGQPDNKYDDYTPTYEEDSEYKADTTYEPKWEYPKKNDYVPCGKEQEFDYDVPEGDYDIDVVFGKGGKDCHDYLPVARDHKNYGETKGKCKWTPPTYIPYTGSKGGYGLRFRCKKTGHEYYTPQFCFENKDFYNEYKHKACPTPVEKPTPIVEEPEKETPCPTPEAPETPVVPPQTVAAPPANNTSPETPVFDNAASSFQASFTFAAGLAVLVAFAL